MKTKVINYRTVCRVMGWMLLLEAAMLILPTLVSISYGENDYKVFLAAIGCCMVPGLLLAQPGRSVNRRDPSGIISAHRIMLGTILSIRHVAPYLVADMLSRCG